MVFNNILEAMGNTPMIRLNRMAGANHAEVLVKYEGLNVGGSIKTRTAFCMIREAEKRGDISPSTVIIEPTSGNQGIGLALIAAVRGYRAIMVMPSSVSEERRKLVENYGAEVVIVEDKGDIGKAIEACLETALSLQTKYQNAYVPQQFINPDNPAIHREQTAREIIEQAGRKIDGFCSGIGTGGTITGVGEILRKHNPDVLIWALEPEKAAILSGGVIRTHVQMGIGDGLIPKNLNTEIYDAVITIPDEEALQTAKNLARLEGLMCGISSGTNVAAALKMAARLGKGKTVVTILPDTAERYFSTPLFD